MSRPQRKGPAKEKEDKAPIDLSEKAYKDTVEDIAKSTVFQPTDLDEKAVKFLDYMEENGGRAKEALEHLKKSLETVQRDSVRSMEKYVYTLLRQVDEEAYQAMKVSEGKKARLPRGSKVPEADKKSPLGPFTFNAEATEFVPGQSWGKAPVAAASESKASDVPAASEKAATAA